MGDKTFASEANRLSYTLLGANPGGLNLIETRIADLHSASYFSNLLDGCRA